MMSIRKLMCKPKIDDWAPLAKFYYADESLNTIAAEVDCFEGTKDPEKYQQLLNQLRQCQDRVIQIIEEIMSDVFPNESDRARRDYRVKFPDDILHEGLLGQLWFGAECLTAGTNIVDRAAESESIRPLARRLTSHLDFLRDILKEQSLKNPNIYSEKLKKALRIYDSLFADFELKYVSIMVPVKSAKEYDQLQDISVLFSETLLRTIQKGYINQDMVDMCDPSIMIALPRLAIICGLLIYPDGPLNVDRPTDELADMFQTFKTLLQKIRELLRTLDEEELVALERALSSQEQLTVDGKKVALISEFRHRSSNKQSTKSNAYINKSTSSSTSSSCRTKEKLTQKNESGKFEESAKIVDAAGSAESSENATIDAEKILDPLISAENNDNRENAAQIFASENDKPVVNNNTVAPSGEKNTPACDVNLPKKPWKPNRSQQLRSRFWSSEDLIHRLFVCISGVADQWQSNYSADLRTVLKAVLHPQPDIPVFEINGRSSLSTVREEEMGVEVDEPIIDNFPIVVPWVPDNECQHCTGCTRPFTFVVRRHHCRNCGKIFCARCSENSLSLPKLGYSKPVRVCDQCFFYKLQQQPQQQSSPCNNDEVISNFSGVF